MDLISAPLPTIQSDNNYELACVQELKQINADILQAIVDSYYAGNTSHCKFVSGICVKLAGGDVLYKTQYQAIIDLSSTEAEFIAACKARKYLLYLRTILSELGGRPQMLATVLYEDNQGALLVATAQKPTNAQDICTSNISQYNIGYRQIYYACNKSTHQIIMQMR